MSISNYDQCVATMRRMLKNLDNIVSKAEAHAEAGNIDPAALLQARLFPDMRNFIFQIQVATDIAKSSAARLTGAEPPKWPDDEESFADVHARIGKAIEYLDTFEPKQFEGVETRKIELNLRGNIFKFTGQNYILRFVIPNFYFHMSTAYALLRHNGVALGKPDFLGNFDD
jgi:hypothetical protein